MGRLRKRQYVPFFSSSRSGGFLVFEDVLKSAPFSCRVRKKGRSPSLFPQVAKGLFLWPELSPEPRPIKLIFLSLLGYGVKLSREGFLPLWARVSRTSLPPPFCLRRNHLDAARWQDHVLVFSSY